MDDRITIRLTKPLLKSINAYCAATQKGRSEAVRFLLERGARQVQTRYSWSEQRADWTRLLRPVVRYFDGSAREILREFSKNIIDELHLAMAGLRDDFSRAESQQGELLEAIDDLRVQLRDSPIWSPELSLTLAEVRGLATGLVQHSPFAKPDVVTTAVQSARHIGKRLGVKAEQFPGMTDDGKRK